MSVLKIKNLFYVHMKTIAVTCCHLWAVCSFRIPILFQVSIKVLIIILQTIHALSLHV